MPVQAMPRMTNESHAVVVGGLAGQSQMAGISSPKVAPIWLPAAVTMGLMPAMYFLAKLAAMP